MQIQGVNDLNVQLTINQYFAQREAFLNGTADSIALAVAPMIADEIAHKNAIDMAGATVIDSTVTITTVSCGVQQAEADVNETVEFLINGKRIQEVVVHKITLYLGDDGSVQVSGDGYIEITTGFTSCSYIDPEMAHEVNAGGSGLCIVEIAKTQIGEGEDTSGATKYGTWFSGIDVYGQDCSKKEWCAIFVYWCAYHANISNTVIKDTSSVPTMYEFFDDKGQYYESKAWDPDTTFTPRAGDLIFINDCPTSPNHLGIVTSCSGGYVYYIDGNSSENGGDVRSTRASLTSSVIVAYARPSYGSTSHEYSNIWTWNETKHWKECAHCEIAIISQAAHTIVQDSMGREMCSVCLYGHAIIMKKDSAQVDEK